MKVLSIIMIVVGFILLLRYFLLIRKCNIRVSATITDIELEIDYRKRVSYYPTYRYKIEHWWYTAKSHKEIPYWMDKPKYKVGDKMDILVFEYDRKFCITADYADFRKMHGEFFGGILAIGLGLLNLLT